MKSIFLKDISIHPDWENFLTHLRGEQIIAIEKEVSKSNFTPSPEKVLRFFETPLNTVNVLILGQDPYPQEGVATGRAFEVGTLHSWNTPFKNISLKNILRNLYKAYSGKIITYTELKSKLDNEFPLLPPSQLFKHWEKQGVLLLNTSFTCEIGSPGSHKHIWQSFTLELLQFINKKNKEITWFLWGNHALEASSKFEIKNKLITQHPMMCFAGENRNNDFLFGTVNCFEPFIDSIDWTGFQLKKGLKTSSKLF